MEKLLKYILLFVVGFSLAASASYAINTPGNASNLDIGTTGIYEGSGAAGTANADGGNTTYMNVSGNVSTTKWQGFYGNVTGNLVLGRGSTVFYDFGATTFTTVIAAPSITTSWASLAATTAAEIDTQWSFGTASDVDQAVDVFTSTDTFAGVASVPSTSIGDEFATGIMEDGDDAAKADYVFVGEINNTAAGGVGFGGDTYDFSLLVPVEAGTETYNFYLSVE